MQPLKKLDMLIEKMSTKILSSIVKNSLTHVNHSSVVSSLTTCIENMYVLALLFKTLLLLLLSEVLHSF